MSAITIGLIVLGCTGIIFLTGALVQFFTLNQLNNTARQKRMNRHIDQLEGHVVVCGCGLLGAELARTLTASSAGFVILEDDEVRAAEAIAQGYLCIRADASSESALLAAGVTRAHALASVLSNDALNVFITLSARAMNPDLLIVARGELPITESKLLHAGADKVVLPTHIGAERITELLLQRAPAPFIDGGGNSQGFARILNNFGVELKTLPCAAESPAVGMTVAAIERQGKGLFLIVQIDRRGGDRVIAPVPSAVLSPGDAVVLFGRPSRSPGIMALFEPRIRTSARG